MGNPTLGYWVVLDGTTRRIYSLDCNGTQSPHDAFYAYILLELVTNMNLVIGCTAKDGSSDTSVANVTPDLIHH